MFYGILRRLMQTGDVSGVKYVSVPEDLFRRILAGAIKNKGIFDERFYLETYPDVKLAVLAGTISSGLEHYVKTGYYESRLPAKLMVDESFYLRRNPDVSTAIKSGKITSAQAHFDSNGFIENRDPYDGFSIF